MPPGAGPEGMTLKTCILEVVPVSCRWTFSYYHDEKKAGHWRTPAMLRVLLQMIRMVAMLFIISVDV